MEQFRALEGAYDPSRDLKPLLAQHKADPKDAATAYELALRLFVVGRCDEAIDVALTLARRNREWKEQAGKRLAVAFFDCLGPEHELAKKGKKRLSTIWFV